MQPGRSFASLNTAFGHQHHADAEHYREHTHQLLVSEQVAETARRSPSSSRRGVGTGLVAAVGCLEFVSAHEAFFDFIGLPRNGGDQPSYFHDVGGIGELIGLDHQELA